jgi:ComF family protein
MMKISNFFKTLIRDMLHTLFPDLCLACRKLPKTRDAAFCVECLHAMPYSDHFLIKENDVTKHFKGRIDIRHGAALLRFAEGGIVQNMLHSLKYKKRKEVGEILGEIAGTKWAQSSLFTVPDVIIPVPVHPKKQRIRGYNQSTVFGYAVGKAINVRLRDDILIKTKESMSQTGKSRTERVENVREVFNLVKPDDIKNRHVLMVDDVVTTGATLEACCLLLRQNGAGDISILAIAAAL